MSDPLAVKSTNPVLNWATAVAVMGLAGGGFTLSFSALRDLAVKSGIDSELAFLWPLIVDGFIVVATASAFALKRHGRRVTWYPWTALIFFSAISVVGNSIHATDARDLRVPVPVATVVSSVPALALLIASHLLVVMIDGRIQKKAPAAVRRQPAVETAPTLSAVPAPAEALRTPASKSQPTRDRHDEDVVASLRGLLESGKQITGSVLAQELGVSERTGRRRLEQFRAKFPELFDVETAR